MRESDFVTGNPVGFRGNRFTGFRCGSSSYRGGEKVAHLKLLTLQNGVLHSCTRLWCMGDSFGKLAKIRKRFNRYICRKNLHEVRARAAFE